VIAINVAQAFWGLRHFFEFSPKRNYISIPFYQLFKNNKNKFEKT